MAIAKLGTTTQVQGYNDFNTNYNMKPTQSLFRRLRRLALTTKQANKGFYKGTGTGSTGRHTKHGGYVIEWEKVRTYVVPEGLKEFTVSLIIRFRG